MALETNNLVEQMSQLDAARNLVLGDAALYPQIVHGILPIIGATSRLELRRWGAEFLAETFSSPSFAQQSKQALATEILGAVQELLNTPEEDTAVLRGAILAAASIYPLIFRAVVDQPHQSALWTTMTAIKHDILKKWGASVHGVKICCIKFVQKVIQVQTQGLISDPRRPEKNETSLSLALEHFLRRFEASLLLLRAMRDTRFRLLTISSSDPILVNSTLNMLPILIRTRPSISHKIVNAILNFNPLKQLKTPLTPTMRVNIKSMERTARALLLNLIKKAPNHPLAGRIQQYIERLVQSHNEVFEEASRKRALPTEATDVVDNAKRARIGAETPPQLKVPPLPPGPTSFGQLFTLTEDVGLTSFDVKQLPVDLIVKIVIPVLTRVDPEALDHASGAVRSRYLTICKKQVFEQQRKLTNAISEEEDEEDYEPEFQPMDAGGATSGKKSAVAEVEERQPDIVSLGSFVLPKPPPLSPADVQELGQETITRIFTMITTLPPSSKSTKDASQSMGFGRLAASSSDRESWFTLFTRLATRASAGLEDDEDEADIHTAQSKPQQQNIANTIRETLYRFVLEDFRARINYAISWMNEEWYNDKVQLRSSMKGEGGRVTPTHYAKWAMKLLEGMLPYLDAKDKVLIRFLSELPELTHPLVQKVKTLANDPERVNLCVQALHYLVLVRPPARQLCLDAVHELYQTIEETRPLATKVLLKWRPESLPDQVKATPASSDPRLALGSANSTPVPQDVKPAPANEAELSTPQPT
ncbi:hypothetical protein FQN57_006144 [Myotisia sp. PD_48]|nr:hypothetical protein FQN57_006144 [Myotisia sp. PD_48]